MKTTLTKLAFSVFAISVFFSTYLFAQIQTDINGPVGSGTFGEQVVALPNGNIVITDPKFSISGGANNVGAVYLYNGKTGALISTVTGNNANDLVGVGGVEVLENGNYVISSPRWNGSATTLGAATFGNSTTGVSGVVSSTNSLIGSTTNDQVGLLGVTALANGNYVVVTKDWDNEVTVNVGAVTFGNGNNGISGTISASNSLVGSVTNDQVGSDGVVALTNGNYVVISQLWDSPVIDAGAVTFGDGSKGTNGIVSSANSLIGSTARDLVGNVGVTALTNGNYVVISSSWNNGGIRDVGAVTFGNGTIGITGNVLPTNSLIGSTANDKVGILGVTALTNGNYVVASPNWDGSASDSGAATFGDGKNGTIGTVSSKNSLVGSSAGDTVGSGGIVALSNGNYVVTSDAWNRKTIPNAGAVTFGNGINGLVGVVSSSNSLIGSQSGDFEGTTRVTALVNGNYVVTTPFSNNGAIPYAGAATLCDGKNGTIGTITPANSLVGSVAYDRVGELGATALANGNYVVVSSFWDRGGVKDAGAVTFGDGVNGIVGAVSESNSLVGSTAFDIIGTSGVTALTNGNYVVSTFTWDDGPIANVGAVTFGNGATGVTGAVSSTNSLVGSKANDWVGFPSVTALPNGNYVVNSTAWDNENIVDAGAITMINGFSGNLAQRKDLSQKARQNTKNFGITPANSVFGNLTDAGLLTFSYNSITNQIAVGKVAENTVTLFSIAPTPVSATVAGTVKTSTGINVPRASVSITDDKGQVRSTRTNQFGYYQFTNVAIGKAYLFNTKAKGLSFSSQEIYVGEDIEDLNIEAQ